MRFQTDLVPAKLIKRYKRFLADIVLPDGEEVTAHCPNPGAMTGLADPGSTVWVEPNTDPKKKLKHGWRLVELTDGHLACVDTSKANRIVGEALTNCAIPALAKYTSVRAEVPYGDKSRVDFMLQADSLPDCYVEIKSVTLARTPGIAEFPDSVTKRGAKHMADLADVARSGARAVVFYLVQRTDCQSATVAEDIDPAYANALDGALDAGVEILVHRADIQRSQITLGPELPFRR